MDNIIITKKTITCSPEYLLKTVRDIASAIDQLPHDSVITSRRLRKQHAQSAMPKAITNQA
ncbi:MAG: hypothetical protein ACJA0T_000932 [Colwellia sp.]|jgi:hypothetical protein